ncbi:hypothetical protein [Hymenobacter rubripertinctus]|uniref:Glycosyltransferase RgtA/B/C/D-like domain-containing protein n=1 Tax=Hymenobacter rubripertinctus TaxID=2029981 RepID=A0A418R1L3_9BACT|nr:hypothetical protein [Hymenobacter rubripertinctus]RIY11316.1 hypothetical protein D0T11_07585 [Hymenobacter rubripertinctus]
MIAKSPSSVLPLPAPAPARVPGWVWAGLVLLHLLALGWQLYHRQPRFPDSERYVQAARNLREAGVLYALPLTEKPLLAQEYTIRPPLYPVFLLLTGGAGPGFPGATLLLQNLLSLLNLGLALRWLARRARGLSARQWAAVLALAAAGPGQFIYANVLMSEMLLQTAVVALWLSLEALFTPGRRPLGPLLVAALATTGALLNKPVFFPFAAVLLGLGLWLAWRQRRVSLAVLGAVPLVVVGLWMQRNEARTGYFHFSSIAEINLLRYNARGVLQAAEGPEAAEQFVRRTLATADSLPTFRAQQRYVQQAGGQALLRHPFAYAAQHLRGMATFLLDPGRFDLVHFLGRGQTNGPGLLHLFNQRSPVAVLSYLGQLPLLLLAVMGLGLLANLVRLALVVRFARSPAYPWPGRLVLLGLVAYLALLTGPLGAARFVVPVLPLLLAAAGAGLAARRAAA